ncbi:unnamed protein product [Cylicocyclus nassatus]|uniref:Integrase catalytic domain-containing protein n=1 Tax=Cylicocyclus nassatus TaxID=53992 RepID=A0AA36GWR4_CYLNA|nr:unnamed protein product [Cylicocyclus nassatus]
MSSDFSTTAFLNVLRRFFGRREVPKPITSDNASTFLRATPRPDWKNWKQLKLAKEGINRQVEAGKAVKNDYAYLKEDFHISQGNTRELMIMTIRLRTRRTASRIASSCYVPDTVVQVLRPPFCTRWNKYDKPTRL